MQKVNDLISIYGGIVPPLNNELPHQEQPIVKEPSSESFPVDTSTEQYPLLGSWRGKIIYGLKFIGTKSVTAKELAAFILTFETSSDPIYINRSTSQYLTNLSKAGIVNVDKSEFPHKYSYTSRA